MGRTSTSRTRRKTADAAPVAQPGVPVGPRPYITDLEWLLKSTQGALHGIGRHVAIIGENGAGKTILTQAAELAESGGATLSGKGYRQAVGDLVQLSPGKTAEVTVRATHSDSSVSTFTLGLRETKHRDGTVSVSYQTEEHSAYEDPFVGRIVADALSSPDAARRFLLRAVGGAVSDEDVVARLPEAVQARYRQALFDPTVKAAGSPAARLVAAQEYASRQITDARNRSTTAQQVIDRGTAGLPQRPLKVDLDDAAALAARLDGELRPLWNVLMQHGLWSTLQGADNSVKAIADRWRATNVTARQALADAQTHVEELRLQEPPKPSGSTEVLQAAVVLGHYHDAAQRGSCLYCKGVTAPAFHAARTAELEAAAGRFARSVQAHCAWRDSLTAAERAQNRTADRVQQLADVVGTVRAFAEALPLVEQAAARSRALQRAEDAWKGWADAQGLVTTAKADETDWQALLDACKVAVKDALGATLDAFVARVQTFLPDEDRFGVVLEEDGREVCRFGFWRCPECHGRRVVPDGAHEGRGAPCAVCAGKGHGTAEDALHSDGALSDAEWRRAFDALVCAWTAARPGAAILLVPDRDVSPVTRRREMERLQTFDGQVFLTMTSAPAGKKLPGWDYVYVGEDGTITHEPATGRSRERKAVDPQTQLPLDKNTDGTPLADQRPGGTAEHPVWNEALARLGYDAGQIARMTDDSRETIVALAIRADEVSVLKDGSFVRIELAAALAGGAPREDALAGLDEVDMVVHAAPAPTAEDVPGAVVDAFGDAFADAFDDVG